MHGRHLHGAGPIFDDDRVEQVPGVARKVVARAGREWWLRSLIVALGHSPSFG
jgi:hypothetical protein